MRWLRRMNGKADHFAWAFLMQQGLGWAEGSRRSEVTLAIEGWKEERNIATSFISNGVIKENPNCIPKYDFDDEFKTVQVNHGLIRMRGHPCTALPQLGDKYRSKKAKKKNLLSLCWSSSQNTPPNLSHAAKRKEKQASITRCVGRRRLRINENTRLDVPILIGIGLQVLGCSSLK